MNTNLKRAVVLILPLLLLACGEIDGIKENRLPPPKYDYPQVGMDGNGNAVTVMRENTDSDSYVVASNYTPSNGWSRVRRIDVSSGRKSEPNIAMNSSGAAIAIWLDAGRVFVNHYTPSTGWATANILDTFERSCCVHLIDSNANKVVMNGNGHAIAVWARRSSYATARYAPDSGWSVPESIGTDINKFASNLSVAMNRNGNAVVVWKQNDPDLPISDVWIKRYSPDLGWESAELIDDNVGNPPHPKVAIDEEGDILVVWRNNDIVLANQYKSDSGWGSAEPIGVIAVGGFEAYWGPKLVANPDGNAIVIWAQTGLIWSNHFDPVLGWGTAQSILSIGQDAWKANIAMDRIGNAIVVWEHNQLWSNQYSINSGWETALQINASNPLNSDHSHVAIDNNGNAIAIWRVSNVITDYVSTSIWSNRYTFGTGWGSATSVAK